MLYKLHMASTISPRFSYRIDMQDAVPCDTAAEAIDGALAALGDRPGPASAEVRDTWFGTQLAALARTPDGEIIDVPF